MMKRLCIYFFYDKDGVVDEYVPFFLRAIRQYCIELCVVVNGFVNSNGAKILRENSDLLLIRENNGLDAGAYKYAIHHYGYDKLSQFDEVICCNFTIFGPLFSLYDLFETMSKKKCDWWGLYKWYTSSPIEYRHIPSFFVAYRKSLLTNDAFSNYWNNLPNISTYDDSVRFHEQVQTPYYDSKGFVSEVYIDDEKYRKFWNLHWPLYCADKLVIEERFPFVKRRNFFLDNYESLYKNNAKSIIKFLKINSSYNVIMIRDNILRTRAFSEQSKQRSYCERLKFRILSKVHWSKSKRLHYKLKTLLSDEKNITKSEFKSYF